MNGFGKIAQKEPSYMRGRGQRSVSIFESVRQARLSKVGKKGSGPTILHKDWNRTKTSLEL